MANIQYPELKYCDIVTHMNHVFKGKIDGKHQAKAQNGL